MSTKKTPAEGRTQRGSEAIEIHHFDCAVLTNGKEARHHTEDEGQEGTKEKPPAATAKDGEPQEDVGMRPIAEARKWKRRWAIRPSRTVRIEVEERERLNAVSARVAQREEQGAIKLEGLPEEHAIKKKPSE